MLCCFISFIHANIMSFNLMTHEILKANTYQFVKEERPKFAYDIEGQPIVVAQAQRHGLLRPRTVHFDRIETATEMELEWYGLDTREFPWRHTMSFLSNECNPRVIKRLVKGAPLTVVDCPYVYGTRPDIAFGRQENIIAAVLAGRRVLYQSIGFDLQEWRASQTKEPARKQASG